MTPECCKVYDVRVTVCVSLPRTVVVDSSDLSLRPGTVTGVRDMSACPWPSLWLQYLCVLWVFPTSLFVRTVIDTFDHRSKVSTKTVFFPSWISLVSFLTSFSRFFVSDFSRPSDLPPSPFVLRSPTPSTTTGDVSLLPLEFLHYTYPCSTP